MRYIEAPETCYDPGIKLFLAGGITGCPNWQAQVITNLQDLDIIIFNPRRKNFPIHDPNAAFDQIKWEFDNLRNSDMISFWFCSETMCPIVLLELGSWVVSSKPLIVGMDPKYTRRQDVEIQTKLARPEIPINYNINDLCSNIAVTYNELKMF